MPLFQTKDEVVMAKQLRGDSSEIMSVCDWIVSHGYPWIPPPEQIDDTMTRVDGYLPKLTKGLYVDPLYGEVVLCTGNGTLRCADGDWVVETSATSVAVVKQVFFEHMYVPIGG